MSVTQISYAEVATALGRWTISFRQSSGALLSLAFTPATEAQLRALQTEHGYRLGDVELMRGRFPAAEQQLQAYARGQSKRFRLEVDLSGLSEFQARVLTELRGVPFGQSVSYGELARRVGCPGGARAIGGVMRRNPVPVVIPCHRVLAAGRCIGGFTGGIAIKQRLLALESISVRA